MKINFATSLTLMRLVFIPILIILFYCQFPGSRILCGCLFALSSITDYFDGYIARNYNQQSKFGAFLDPVADKLSVGVALILLVEQHHAAYMTIPAVIIVGRELVISALREWMAELGQRASIAVSYVGKVKTCTQMAAISFLLGYKTGIWNWLDWSGLILIYVASLLTLWSMWQYLKIAWPSLMES